MANQTKYRDQAMTEYELFVKGDALYDSGDFLGAFELFNRAAESGLPNCMLRVATMYSSGEGVALDLEKAIKWELKAIELGEVCGMINVGISYRLKGDLVNAHYWFERSLAAGDGCGALELAKLLQAGGADSEKVAEYLRLAITTGPMCEADIEDIQEMLAEIEAKR